MGDFISDLLLWLLMIADAVVYDYYDDDDDDVDDDDIDDDCDESNDGKDEVKDPARPHRSCMGFQ